MINTKDVLDHTQKFDENYGKIFDNTVSNSQTVTVYEDDYIHVYLTLTATIQRSNMRYCFATLKYKSFTDLEKESVHIKVNTKKPILKQINANNLTIHSLTKSLLETCNISNLHTVNFMMNGYSLEVVKQSHKYVTVVEFINAVSFEKRFDTIESLINYIEYRKDFHNNVSITVNVSDSEVQQLEKSIRTMEHTTSVLYDEIIDRIMPSSMFLNKEDVNITDITKFESVIKFNIDIKPFDSPLECIFNSVNGVSVTTESCDFDSRAIKQTMAQFEILAHIERQSGYFTRYTELILQLEKFRSKSTTTKIDAPLKQMDVNEVSKMLTNVLRKARQKESMLSDKVAITSLCGYKRYLQLSGVMKNRKRCDLIVYAERKGQVFEEYKTQVEKNRMFEEAQNFLKRYYV